MTDLNLTATLTDGGSTGVGGLWDTPSRANDGNPATYAEIHSGVFGPGTYLMVADHGSPVTIGEMNVIAETTSALGPQAGYYTFDSSTDGSSWTPIPLTETITIASYSANYLFDSPVTARYFRLRGGYSNGAFQVGRRVATWEAVEHTASPPPVADFSGSPRFGPSPLSVDFDDESTNTPTSWAWDFGDGGTSTSQNPTHVYTDPGTYTVSLTATNAFGSDTETKIAYIVVASVPAGVGVDVYTPGDAFIATLARPQDQTIRLELNGPGSGYFVINRNDVQATAEILSAGNICRVTVPEIDSTQPLFDWIMETGDFDLISSDEEGGEDLAFAGRGSLVDLERALIWDVTYVDGSSWVMADKGVWRFENKTAGYIVRQILQEAVNRGVLPDLIVAFGAETDSDGNAWPTMAGRYEIPIGSNAYEEVLKLVALGQMKIRMDPGFWLRAYVNLGADKTGAFGTGNVRFERAVNIVDNLNRDWQGWLAGTHALVHGEVSYVHAESPAYSPGDVVREVFLDQTNMTADGDLEDAGLAVLATRNDAGTGLVFAHLPGDDDAAGLYLPGPTFTEHGKYMPGDLVTLDTGTGGVDYDAATQRVYAVTISRDEAGQIAPPMVELNSPWMGDDEPFAGASSPAGSRIGSPGGSTGGFGGGSGGTGGGFQTAAQTPYDDSHAPALGEDRVQGALDALKDAIAANASDPVPWFNVEDFGAVHDGSTDDLPAFVAAMSAAAAAGGGFITGPDGEYVWSGARSDTGRSNAQLVLPILDTPTDDQITIVIGGFTPPTAVPSVGGAVPLAEGGMVIRSTLASGAGNVIGGWGPSGSFQDFTLVRAVLRNITIRTIADPTITAVDFSHVNAVELDNVMVDSSNYDVGSIASQTTSTSYGIKLPQNGNGASTIMRNVNVVGFYNGILVPEHTIGDNVAVWASRNPYVFPTADHATHFGRLGMYHCKNGLVFTGNHYFSIEQLNIEHASSGTWTPTVDITDASNFGHGHLAWHTVLAGTGTDHTFTVSGATDIYRLEIGDDPFGSSALTGVDFLVGTATGLLSAEIAVGTTPGGELGGTWASPTVDATHAGSTHVALSSATPLVESGAGSAGSGSTASKGDHIHPAAATSSGGTIVMQSGTSTPPVPIWNSAGDDYVYSSS